MKKHNLNLLFITLVIIMLSACATVPDSEISYDPEALQFDGEAALATDIDFVQQFPNRDSGQPNNRLAIEALQTQFTDLGLTCEVQEWEIINYNVLVPLNNLVCELAGESPKQIAIMAHHDQAPMAVEGADNDGSGIAILLELAKIFAAEPTPAYTLVFISSDAEEYGMIGSGHYIETHPNPEQVIAGFSLDNLGKYFYDGMDMSPIGQFRGYGASWLQRYARDAAAAAGDIWVPKVRAPLSQAIDQAVPISFMDQGPLVAAGVPAIGFAAIVPPEFSEDHWESFHTPADTTELLSAASLFQAGRITEAIVRQLLAMDSFPQESGPYLYFEESESVFRGPALWLLFALFPLLFLVGSLVFAEKPLAETFEGWKRALPAFLGLWLPLLASVLLLYLLVAVGLMDKFHLYPATNKDPILFEPRWPAVIIYLLGLGLFLYLGRKAVARLAHQQASFAGRKSLALLVIGIACLLILLVNPFTLFALLPVLLWFFIGDHKGVDRLLDLFLFLLGGLIVAIGLYHFGFNVLRNNWAILWYVMMMVSIRMIGFVAMMVLTAVVAAGLSMVVTPPPVTEKAAAPQPDKEVAYT